MTDRQKILAIAHEVRKPLLADELGNCEGCCQRWSERLRTALLVEGFFCEVVRGTFYIDCPSDHKTHWLPQDCKHYASHYWIEVAGPPKLIVDITADQFNPEIQGEKMPEVLIGTVEEVGRRYGPVWDKLPHRCARPVCAVCNCILEEDGSCPPCRAKDMLNAGRCPDCGCKLDKDDVCGNCRAKAMLDRLDKLPAAQKRRMRAVGGHLAKSLSAGRSLRRGRRSR